MSVMDKKSGLKLEEKKKMFDISKQVMESLKCNRRKLFLGENLNWVGKAESLHY